VFGGKVVAVTPSVTIPVVSPTVQCKFEGVASAAATKVGSSYECTVPAAKQPTQSSLALVVNSVNYAPPVPFSYFSACFILSLTIHSL
jgi:hypothetical protein